MFKNVVIIFAAGTPVGSFGGSVKDISTIALGTLAVKTVIK